MDEIWMNIKESDPQAHYGSDCGSVSESPE